MSTLLVPALYFVSGLCAFAALHHGIAAMHRRANRVHIQFAGLSLFILVLVLAKAGAYQAQTAEALVGLRKLEVSAISRLFSLSRKPAEPNTVIKRPGSFVLGA